MMPKRTRSALCASYEQVERDEQAQLVNFALRFSAKALRTAEISSKLRCLESTRNSFVSHANFQRWVSWAKKRLLEQGLRSTGRFELFFQNKSRTQKASQRGCRHWSVRSGNCEEIVTCKQLGIKLAYKEQVISIRIKPKICNECRSNNF